MADKKFYLSNNKKLAGVCGGIADYFGIDPTVVRIGFTLLTLFSSIFPGLLIYFIIWAIAPSR